MKGSMLEIINEKTTSITLLSTPFIHSINISQPSVINGLVKVFYSFPYLPIHVQFICLFTEHKLYLRPWEHDQRYSLNFQRQRLWGWLKFESHLWSLLKVRILVHDSKRLGSSRNEMWTRNPCLLSVACPQVILLWIAFKKRSKRSQNIYRKKYSWKHLKVQIIVNEQASRNWKIWSQLYAQGGF